MAQLVVCLLPEHEGLGSGARARRPASLVESESSRLGERLNLQTFSGERYLSVHLWLLRARLHEWNTHRETRMHVHPRHAKIKTKRSLNEVEVPLLWLVEEKGRLH